MNPEKTRILEIVDKNEYGIFVSSYLILENCIVLKGTEDEDDDIPIIGGTKFLSKLVEIVIENGNVQFLEYFISKCKNIVQSVINKYDVSKPPGGKNYLKYNFSVVYYCIKKNKYDVIGLISDSFRSFHLQDNFRDLVKFAPQIMAKIDTENFTTFFNYIYARHYRLLKHMIQSILIYSSLDFVKNILDNLLSCLLSNDMNDIITDYITSPILKVKNFPVFKETFEYLLECFKKLKNKEILNHGEKKVKHCFEHYHVLDWEQYSIDILTQNVNGFDKFIKSFDCKGNWNHYYFHKNEKVGEDESISKWADFYNIEIDNNQRKEARKKKYTL